MKQALIVEDMAETRLWLGDILQAARPDMGQVAVASVAAARHHLRSQGCPDLALVDLGLPDGTGMDVIRLIKASRADAVCIAATVLSDDASVVAALAAGADGYLLKDQPAEALVQQLRQIDMGLAALSPAIARRIIDHFRLTGPMDPGGEALTPRESDVLRRIGRGLRNAEVATDLGIAESTVAGYIKSVYRKLGISSRAEAAWHATRMGLNG
ncbi:response regulator [Salipiger marinus]|uniref:Two component transcriptional regulator, LuxR family n=1 Tax=Salipiger marinus TaxID=555512 RepID=A0A1G8JUV2_9RHOB|nr:response regulator transcription factor [Salipiger marinus]SDI34992.1 two component transcriptional regulator, LuxR family [Salipiger marinus]HBT00217.1 DNA-binding response regulator [Citreicella sp.]